RNKTKAPLKRRTPNKKKQRNKSGDESPHSNRKNRHSVSGDCATGPPAMRYLYFTKFLRELDLAGLVGFCKDTGVQRFDLSALAVRPGYDVHPGNVATELPKAGKLVAAAGLVRGLVTLPTGAVDPESKAVRAVFEACGKAGVPAIKLGYFPYTGKIDDALKE